MTAADRARARMAEHLRTQGRLRSADVEDAFRAVPRHLFLPGVPIDEAYADEAVAVQLVDGAATSSASQPSMMAIMLEQLALRPGHRVLEIGAGTGYNAALMARIVGPTGSVTAVDIDAGLVESAALHLAAAGVTGVELRCADGALGHPDAAPYDRIVLTVGSSDVRPEWVAQLAPGGRLLLPLALRGSQLSVALDLGPDGLLRSDSIRGCAFIRLRGIGASPRTCVALGGGVSLELPEDTPEVPDAGEVGGMLDAPGPIRPAPAPLGPQDVWDGFGLWLALTDPRTVRLLGARGLYPVGAGGAAPALLGPGPGIAVAGPAGYGDGWPRAAGVRAFGPGGGVPAERLVGALATWDVLGRPRAAGLRLLVAPRPHPVVLTPGVAMVPTPSAVVLASWDAPAG